MEQMQRTLKCFNNLDLCVSESGVWQIPSTFFALESGPHTAMASSYSHEWKKSYLNLRPFLPQQIPIRGGALIQDEDPDHENSVIYLTRAFDGWGGIGMWHASICLSLHTLFKIPHGSVSVVWSNMLHHNVKGTLYQIRTLNNGQYQIQVISYTEFQALSFHKG